MAKVTFTVESDATLQTIFVTPASTPDQGVLVALKSKGGKRSGSIELESGLHFYLMRFEGGAPSADWKVTLQRDERPPVERKGTLDKKGNGGDVGQITIK